MIGKLTGTVSFTGTSHLVLDVGGVGYKVSVLSETLRVAGKEKTLSLWIHTAVRETAIDLYGFATRPELEFFELLITVSGIGPKSALSVLGLAPVDSLKKAVAAGDSAYLTKVSGIGKKIAEKIIVELRDKLGGGFGTHAGLQEDSDVLDALASLGYSVREAREALKGVDKGISGTEAKVKAVLKKLGK